MPDLICLPIFLKRDLVRINVSFSTFVKVFYMTNLFEKPLYCDSYYTVDHC